MTTNASAVAGLMCPGIARPSALRLSVPQLEYTAAHVGACSNLHRLGLELWADLMP